MNLAVYEWRKLFRLPALWAFLALCLAFNGLLIATLSPYDRAFFNETSQTAKALGQRVDEDFFAGLDAIPATENRDLLRQSVTGMEDIFETYDTGELSDFYAGVVEKSPLAVTWMTWKYDLLASRVEHLAQTDAALDLYAGPATYGSHQFLFGALFRAILCESAILAMLGTLYLLGYEGMHRAEGLACASRTGRKLRRCTACWRSAPWCPTSCCTTTAESGMPACPASSTISRTCWWSGPSSPGGTSRWVSTWPLP